MEHQGQRLKTLSKAKGFNMKQLATQFGITRTAVENHFKSETVSRNVATRYADLLGFSLDEFFDQSSIREVREVKGTVPAEIYSELQKRYFDLEDKYNDLLVRFFPNAVQQPAIS